MEKTVQLSVHDFVDLILRRGDIDNRIFNVISMNEGSRLHAWYQGKQGPEYAAEVYLEDTFEYGGFTLDMDGRADGIITHGPDDITVDEIKTTNADIEKFYKAQKDWHLGQGQVYAYMVMRQKNLASIKVQLTYISQADNTEVKQYLFFYGRDELQSIIEGYLKTYVSYLSLISGFKEERQKSLIGLSFPFPVLRSGQKELMDFADETIKDSAVGYCEAKTGIGKTVSCLYPYIKALGSEKLEKVFYLTSKNSIKEVAYETLKRLEKEGSRCKAVILSSKESICPNADKRHCNPDECPYAQKYYDKVNTAIFTAFQKQDIFAFKDILELAMTYKICPFEMQLDMLNYADVIVGDYNYLFDPNARLMRFFQTYSQNPFLLLVDEAHNLPDRVRDMFSAEINREDIKQVILSLKAVSGKAKLEEPVIKALMKIDTFLAGVVFADSGSKYPCIMEEEKVPDLLQDVLNGFVQAGKTYLRKKKKIPDRFLDLYYLTLNFSNLPEKDSKYAYYFTFDSSLKDALSFSVKCLDPRYLIKQGFKAFRAGICFSATLSPKNYFIDLLGGDKDSLTLYLPSPFKEENRLVLVDDRISCKYKDRDYSLGQVSDAIMAFISPKCGNYFVFFPSFEYMNKIRGFFEENEDIDCYFQSSAMGENERRAFLSHFRPDPYRTTVGFIVLGGIFAEGIDLAADRLIGACIVSVGLPKISYLSSRIMAYFGEDDPNAGFLYAYTYPGINKVFQAAGRVIRGEEDKGVILYIDTRYSYAVYKENIAQMYPRLLRAPTSALIRTLVKSFWEKNGK